MGCDIHAWIVKGNKVVKELDIDRNYTLFGVLAGVRADIEPIVPRRGWPKELPAELEEFSYDFHSYSWLTAEEIKAHLVPKPIVKLTGIMDMQTYRQFKTTGNPCPYCQDVWGHKVKVLNPDEADSLAEPTPGIDYHVRVSWEWPASKAYPQLEDAILPELEQAGEGALFVFAFDS